ncbi:MAG: amino acid ABC transporter permease [Ruminococcaceae bacterium]|nr:amino acid ABC transporter permease [Oscillospiraceae bacterium]
MSMISRVGFARTFQFLSMFRDGLICTISLSALTVVFGFVLALILAVMRLSNLRPMYFLAFEKDGRLREQGFLAALARFRPLNFIATVYVEVFRATPLLVQLFIIYYIVFAPIALPTFKLFGFIRFERFLPGVVALAMNSGAYLSEIIRAGIQSIDGGQTEAARSLGMSQMQNMRFIILPQAVKNILPAIANEFVTIIKESSVCYTIGVQEIMYAVSSVKGATFSIGEPLIVATLVYFCLTFPTSKIIAYFERKMSSGDRRTGPAKTNRKVQALLDEHSRKAMRSMK